MFDIHFESSPDEDLESTSLQGQIQLGNFQASFSSSLEYWSPVDYELQWLRGIRAIAEGGEKSCLITSITNPATAHFLVWWEIYRVDASSVPLVSSLQTSENHGNGELVLFRNDILLLDDIRSEFDLLHLEAFVPELSHPAEPNPMLREVDDQELTDLLLGQRQPTPLPSEISRQWDGNEQEWLAPLNWLVRWYGSRP